MTSPEETRDRIKKMRDRIFKEPDEVPLENNESKTLQEKELPAEKTKVVQKDEISSKMAKPTNLQEKLKQNGDRLSLFSAETQRQISEIAQEFATKTSSLETTVLDKLENSFAESNSKIDGIEHQVNENASGLSQANTALKNEINELNGSLQLDINSVTKRFSSENQKIEKELENIETEIQNNADKLSKFENSIKEKQNK